MKRQMNTKNQSIKDIFKKNGVTEIIGGNSPFLLDGIDNVWFIRSGKVEIFSVEIKNNKPFGPRHHFYTVAAGQVLFGMDIKKYGNNMGLLAVGFQGTELQKLNIVLLYELVKNTSFLKEIKYMIDSWVTGLSYGVARDTSPCIDTLIKYSDKVTMRDGEKIRSKDDIVWIKNLTGRALFIGMEEISSCNEASLFPISHDSWFQALDDVNFETIDTEDAVKLKSFWQSLEYFHEIILLCESFNTRLIEVDDYNHLQMKTDTDHIASENALNNLANILKKEKITPFYSNFDQPLLEACKIVGKELDISIKSPPEFKNKSKRKTDPLADIAKASSILIRRVILKDNWWKKDCGPLLAFYEENQQPVALIPVSSKSYEIYDTVKNQKILVTEKVVSTLSPVSYVFYRPFPNQTLSIKDLLQFALRGLKKDIILMLLMGVVSGILAMMIPIATGLIIDSIIPSADHGQLFQLTIILITIAISTTLFFIVRSLLMLRVETKMGTATQAAVWDRLLNLPVTFFQNYTAGDLSDRANGINAIRRIISKVANTSILGGIFAVFNFALLFYYSSKLTLLAAGLTLFAMCVTFLIGYFQLRYQREIMEIHGNIAGKVLQFITGISKLKVSGSEGRAFNVWARAFTNQRRFAFRARTFQNIQEVFNAVFPVLASILIFIVFLKITKDELMAGRPLPLTLGQFISFYSAYGMFIASAIQLSIGALSILTIVPIYERIKPIIKTLPEITKNRYNPGVLTGKIEINNIKFRYRPDESLILNNVSLQVNQGEFVAVVGPSGSGKSTLLRLLLGFEQPESGLIYYDNHDIARIDIQVLRRQIGVVLQNGKLMPGSIFNNIVGSSLYTIEDAWNAARMAGLEKDIRQMPMGMHTIISEGGGGFSGGQRQRLMIARAIVSKPSIIFFDEATSSLDNHTQAIVSKSLEDLQASRFVIAHRLSTIINAHKIIVIESGKIVQQGNYKELINQKGPFAELAKRQLA